MSIQIPGQISHSNPNFAIADITDVRGGVKNIDILDTASLGSFAADIDKFLIDHSIIIENSTNKSFRLRGSDPLDESSWELVSTVFNGLEVSRVNIDSYIDTNDLVGKINNLPTFSVGNNVIKIFNGLLQDPNLGNFIQKHFLVSQDTKFGLSGSQIDFNNLELFYQQDLSSLGSASNIINAINPNAVNYDLGTQSSDDIVTIVNTSGPYVVAGEDVYFSFNAADANYIFRFLITASGSYGLSASGVTQSDFLEFYNSNVDAFVEGTYDDIYSLKTNGLLIPNKNYIITDYQTKYMIPHTDTSTIINSITSIGAVSGYLQFPLTSTLSIGTVFTITALPPGYAGTHFVGQTGSITNTFGTEYYIFSVFIENAANIGVTFQYEIPRYTAMFSQLTLLDTYGNTICKPGGVINTDVHGGTAYGTMSAIENSAPPVERLIITAVSPNKFSLHGFSDTFENDVIEYDINDNTIEDYNGNIIGNRKGFILKRSNDILGISMNKDWRAQKYRRYRVTDALFDRYKYTEDVYKTSGIASGGMPGTLYASDGHRYSLLDLENPYHINDFTAGITVSNIFASSSNTTTIDTLLLFRPSTSQLKYYFNFNLNSSGLLFKDYNIIPLDSSYNPTAIVTDVIVKDLDNVIFRDNVKNFGSSSDIIVLSEFGSIKNSTFLSGVLVKNNNTMDYVLTFDTGEIENTHLMERVRIMCNSWVRNDGLLYNVSFGGRASGLQPHFLEFQIGDGCRIINSMIGGNYIAGFKISNSDISSSFFYFGYSYQSELTSSKCHLTAFRDGNQANGQFLINTTFNLSTGFQKNPNKVNSYGYDYTFTASSIYHDKFFETMENKNFSYNSKSTSGTIFVTASVPS